MRVVSLVPSLTETLLTCDVEVVGRTRYCIHPEPGIRDVPVVGGTKSVDWERVQLLQPDLIVMDREENTRDMAESCPFPWHATHITSVDNVGEEIGELADRVSNEKLQALAGNWKLLASKPAIEFRDWHHLPGFKKAIGNISGEFDAIEYLIWRDPWMAVSSATFIGSMLGRVGLAKYLPDHKESYPELIEDLPKPGVFYLFSSEPYPFGRYAKELEAQGFSGALVDGEFYSWFGIRSYLQLKAYLK
ncbi:MAG: ABC transporter substrate-binding protein [Gammaproteobacteria bacterium]|nr:ABC transporter substrate-binding protein [Gammaproteobacteria bacterium]MBT4491913.1 ABC transporter substrate-binding protein [Gammaproteobacteria bacterium]